MDIVFYRLHCPDIGQLPQLPQLQTMDLPLRFFLTILTIIAVTMPIRTAQMMIVQMFPMTRSSVTLLPFVCIFIRRAKIISGSKRNSENTKLPDNSLEEGAARGSASFSDKWFSVRNNDAAYRGKKAAGENRRAALCIR